MHAPVAAVKNETTPITELNQQRASMKRPDEETGFSDAVPTRLTKCGGMHSTWHWNPCSLPSSPESLPRALHAAPAAPAGSASASRSEKSPSPSVERLGGAYAPRTQLQRAQIRGDDAGAHIDCCGSAEAGGRSFEVDHLSHMGKCDLYYHHITVRKYHKRA